MVSYLLHIFRNGSKSPSLVNRNFLTLRDYSGDEIKTMLWTAMDLKQRIISNGEVRFSFIMLGTHLSVQGFFLDKLHRLNGNHCLSVILFF